MRKLKAGPAAMMTILARGDFDKKELSAWPAGAWFSSSSPSSPSMAQEPPRGRIFSEYRVPLFLLTQERSLGPKPTENSTTVTPFNFAKRKCPNS